MAGSTFGWPASGDDLIDVQRALGREAAAVLARQPWSMAPDALVGGCFLAYAPGEAGPGRPGDRAWAAAVTWAPDGSPERGRGVDRHLRGARGDGGPRRADDVIGQAVVAGQVPAAYERGLLALREGPMLADAVARLRPVPDVLLVDATGLDHPRRAGLAVHLGAVAGIPTVGVTHRPLVASGDEPDVHRGATSPVEIGGVTVGFWVRTRTGARPVVAHAGWRTTPATAAATVLAASTEAARAPVPLQEARRVAREARSVAE